MRTKEPIIINAFHGLGDIIFEIPLHRELIRRGHSVIHPYLDCYGPIWKHWPEIFWIPKKLLAINYDDKRFIERPDYKILPLRWSSPANYKVMKAKYDMIDMDFMEWQKVTWLRDGDAEDKVMDILGIAPGDKYIFINEMFQHNDQGRMRIKVDVPQGMRVVHLKKISGFTLMDWGKVLENASEIHTVGTSINYIIDPPFLNINCPVHLYIRRPNETNFDSYNYLLKKEYIWHHE